MSTVCEAHEKRYKSNADINASSDRRGAVGGNTVRQTPLLDTRNVSAVTEAVDVPDGVPLENDM